MIGAVIGKPFRTILRVFIILLLAIVVLYVLVVLLGKRQPWRLTAVSVAGRLCPSTVHQPCRTTFQAWTKHNPSRHRRCASRPHCRQIPSRGRMAGALDRRGHD
jgi:hypothetical protein